MERMNWTMDGYGLGERTIFMQQVDEESAILADAIERWLSRLDLDSDRNQLTIIDRYGTIEIK